MGPTTSAVTLNPARACASVVTVLPSTTSSAGSVMLSPTALGSFSTSTTSPTATLCCLPPVRTTAYTATPLLLDHCISVTGSADVLLQYWSDAVPHPGPAAQPTGHARARRRRVYVSSEEVPAPAE